MAKPRFIDLVWKWELVQATSKAPPHNTNLVVKIVFHFLFGIKKQNLLEFYDLNGVVLCNRNNDYNDRYYVSLTMVAMMEV